MTDRCELCATVLSARRLRVKVSRGPKADLARRQVGPRLRSTPKRTRPEPEPPVFANNGASEWNYRLDNNVARQPQFTFYTEYYHYYIHRAKSPGRSGKFRFFLSFTSFSTLSTGRNSCVKFAHTGPSSSWWPRKCDRPLAGDRRRFPEILSDFVRSEMTVWICTHAAVRF